jgi:predicted FMN-binding regulatory protein PaiB
MPSFHAELVCNQMHLSDMELHAMQARGNQESSKTKQGRARRAAPHRGALYDTPLGGSWDFDAMPFDFVAPRLDMIAAVEIPVRVLEGKYKLNQDRSEEDRRGVIAALERLGDPQGVAVAGLMKLQMAALAGG